MKVSSVKQIMLEKEMYFKKKIFFILILIFFTNNVSASIKENIINKINNLEERVVDESFINFTIKENDIEINIFFDNKTFNLIGWQTKDIYQNLNITFLTSIKINEIFSNDLFRIPAQN